MSVVIRYSQSECQSTQQRPIIVIIEQIQHQPRSRFPENTGGYCILAMVWIN